MKNKTLKYIVLASFALTPVFVFAAPLDGLRGLLVEFSKFINLFIQIIFGLAMIYFFWGLSQFILHSSDPKKLAEGRSKMVWGIVAIFVFLSIYGIIYFIGNTLGIGVGGNINPSSGIITPGSTSGGSGGNPCPALYC